MRTHCLRTAAMCLWLVLSACAAHALPARLGQRAALGDATCSSALPVLPSAAVAASAQPRNALLRPLIAAVTAGPVRELLVYDLQAQAVLWRKPVPAQARPQILGDVLVTTVANAMVGFDLASGKERWRVALDHPVWLGAAQTGSQLLFTTSTDADNPNQRGATVTAIDSTRGALLWQRSYAQGVARPSCRQNLCYLLSDHRDLLAVRSDTGAQLRCSRLASGNVEWLDARSDGLYYGASTAHVVRVADPGAATTAVDALPVPSPELPGQTGPYPSSHTFVPAQRSAYGRIALAVQLDAGSPDRSMKEGERYASIFYRVVFGHHRDGTLAWARMLQHDVVRSQATRAGLVVALEDGQVRLLDWQTGGSVRQAALEVSIDSADLDAESLAAAPPKAETRPLRSALVEIALDPDARLLPARLLAIDALAVLADGEASRDLLDIYRQAASPQAVRERIAARLLLRRQGTEHLVDALLLHRDFLDGTPLPALSAIVPALVAQHQTRAVPRLVEQLFAPDTPASELPGLVLALTQLGDATVNAELARFLRLYHADSSLGADPRALVAAASALLERGDSEAKALVVRIAHSPHTLPALRASLLDLPWSGVTQPTVHQTSGAAAATSALDLPGVLSDAAVYRTFAEHAEDLRRCMLEELARRPETGTVRLSFVADHAGSASAIHVTPDRPELNACLRQRVAGYSFPRFRAGRRVVNFIIGLRDQSGAAAEPALGAPNAGQEFWRLSQTRADPRAPIASTAPFWRNQNALFVSVDKEPVLTPPVAKLVQPPRTQEQAAPLPPRATKQDKSDQGAASTDAAAPPADDAWWLPARQE